MNKVIKVLEYLIAIIGCLLLVVVCLYSYLVEKLEYKDSMLLGIMCITLFDVWQLSNKKGEHTRRFILITEIVLVLLFIVSIVEHIIL